MKTKIFILAGFIILLMLAPVSAIPAVPEMPAQIYGTLYNHEGIPFPVGTVITAEVNGVTSTYTITEAGKIGGSGTFDKKFLIDGATAGSIITFSISGISETITMTYNPNAGGQSEPIKLIFQTSSSSFPSPQGSVTWLTETPTETTPDSTDQTTPSPTQTTEAKSPMPIFGIITGFGVVYTVLRRKYF